MGYVAVTSKISYTTRIRSCAMEIKNKGQVTQRVQHLKTKNHSVPTEVTPGTPSDLNHPKMSVVTKICWLNHMMSVKMPIKVVYRESQTEYVTRGPMALTLCFIAMATVVSTYGRWYV